MIGKAKLRLDSVLTAQHSKDVVTRILRFKPINTDDRVFGVKPIREHKIGVVGAIEITAERYIMDQFEIDREYEIHFVPASK